MLDRLLILHHEGAPVAWGTTMGEIRTYILDYPPDDAELFQVWSVPGTRRLSVANDMTKRFALEWSREFDFADGTEPETYLRFFPVFVRHHAGDALKSAWEAGRAKVDHDFLPNVLRTGT